MMQNNIIVHKLILSDVYSGLHQLDDKSIDLTITSPPYWNQRDYGFNDQIGNEKTPSLYIKKLSKIFEKLKDKMKKNGIFFLNIGDKYLSKYGKSSIGFIPFLLAAEMEKSGWHLIDILIWFKPNHMPSSIKNRFINSYEPIFVFSPSLNNIYNNNKKNHLKINLQPTPYKHVAVFPEKLVKELIGMVKLKNNAIILDPFAGSGTTLKVIKSLDLNISGIMIEKNLDYIQIIKERCNLNGDYIELKYNDLSYNIQEKDDNEQYDLFNEYANNLELDNLKKGLVKVFDSKKDYYKFLEKFMNHSIKLKYSLDAIFFIGSKEFDLGLILQTASLIKYGWVIRNIIVVEDKNKWYPLFFIVDDNKKYNYLFNYKNLNLKSKSNYNRDWTKTNFIGYQVFDSIDKGKKSGEIIKVLETYTNNFPKYVIVEWFDNKLTKEFIIYNQDDINNNLSITINNFKVIEENEIINLQKSFNSMITLNNSKIKKEKKNNYNGKYLTEKRINWGASPGARSSIEEEYFSLQRLYEVDQKLVADYLNFKRSEKGLSKKELTNLFPQKYKHTVGHWLRKDFGGSIPTPSDWMKLSKILNLDKDFTNYVCKTALKLQTVKHSDLKPPKDYISESFILKLNLLFQN